jgi:ubiquinone/menaquinone biosynthesis C-methylase UbiE
VSIQNKKFWSWDLAEGFDSLTVTDVNQAYLDQIKVPCKKVLASATELPFEDNSFEMVFAAGLYHHLSDEEFLKSVKEIHRVLKPNGVFLNIDNMPPTRAYRVLAGMIRKMDRGRFVRTIPAQKSIMESQFAIDKCESGTYSWCGLEYVLHVCRKRA